MPTEILLLGSTSSPNDLIAVGGSDKVAVVTDNSDSTYIVGGGNEQRFTIAPPSTYYGENLTGTINSISFVIRAKGLSSQRNLFVKVGTGGSFTSESSYFYDNVNPENHTFTFTTRPGGGAWTFSDLNDLYLNLRNTTGGGPLIAKIDLSVDMDVTHFMDEPSSLTISDIDSDFVELTWSDDSDVETGFEIQRSEDEVAWETVGTVGANVETFTDGTVASVTEYFYRVRSFNDHGVSDWSDTVSDTTPAYSGPAETPTSLVAIDLTNTSVDITWVDGGFTDSFELQQSNNEGDTWTTIAELDKDTPFFEISGRLPGSSYQFRVRGINTVGSSSWTDPITVTFPERSFREFLQNEVLQDVVNYFRWYDRVYLPDQVFTVTQTFHIATNMSARDAQRITRWDVASGGSIFDGVFHYKQVSTVKVTPPLIAPLPVGTYMFQQDWTGDADAWKTEEEWEADVIAAYTAEPLTPPGAVSKVVVAQNPSYVDEDGTVLVSGAGIGDTIIYLAEQRVDVVDGVVVPYNVDDGRGSGLIPYWMGLHDPGFGLAKSSNMVSADLTVTTTIDYSQDPFDASPIYKAMTDEALFRIGYEDESEVPEELYQKFRDAGRIAAWRFVAYSAVHLNTITETKTIDEVGSVDITKALNQIFEMALRELDIAEQTYRARYITAPVVVTTVSKPRPSSYSSGVTVRF